MKLSKIKTLLKFASKQKRMELNHCFVDNGNLIATDLSTSVMINNDFGLHEGHYKIAELGDFSTPLRGADPVYIHWNQRIESKTLVKISDLESVSKHASKDETRICLNTVCFDNTNMAATNGYHLKLVKLDVTLTSQYLIHRDSVKIIIDFCKDYKITDIEIKFNSEFATIETMFFTIQCRLIQQEYLKYQMVIPKSFKHTIQIYNFPDIKAIKPYIDAKKPTCKLTGIDGIVHLVIGENISIVVGKTDKEFTLGFNPYFIDIAKEKSKTFTIKWNTELNPCEINNCIVMPLKL